MGQPNITPYTSTSLLYVPGTFLIIFVIFDYFRLLSIILTFWEFFFLFWVLGPCQGLNKSMPLHSDILLSVAKPTVARAKPRCDVILPPMLKYSSIPFIWVFIQLCISNDVKVTGFLRLKFHCHVTYDVMLGRGDQMGAASCSARRDLSYEPSFSSVSQKARKL